MKCEFTCFFNQQSMLMVLHVLHAKCWKGLSEITQIVWAALQKVAEDSAACKWRDKWQTDGGREEKNTPSTDPLPAFKQIKSDSGDPLWRRIILFWTLQSFHCTLINICGNKPLPLQRSLGTLSRVLLAHFDPPRSLLTVFVFYSKVFISIIFYVMHSSPDIQGGIPACADLSG